MCVRRDWCVFHFDQPQIQRGGQGRVLRFVLAFVGLERPTPGDVPVIVSDAPSLLQLRITRLMQSHDHIDSACLARGNEGVGAGGAVSDEDVALAQMFEHAPREPSVVRARLAFDRSDPSAAIQIEEAEHGHERKAAAGLLLGAIGIGGGVFFAIGHAQTGAIHDQHTAAFPRQRSKLFGDMGMHS